MIIEPKIRGFLCTTAHPDGCRASVEEQIRHVQKGGPVPGGPKRALIIGSSTGYGLASRIAAAFGSGAGTLGVAFERPSEVVALLKNELGPVDLFVYSLAAPRRTNPATGISYRSTLKPIGAPYTNKTLDFNTGVVSEVTLDPASPEEVEATIQVMGGEDWELWTDLLIKEGLLAPGAKVLAYSYIGPDVTQPVYRNGTIGAAKDHLEATAHKLDGRIKAAVGGEGAGAWVSVNKALVTQASSAIPFMPLYISLLYKVMKDQGVHEGCIEQMDRLFRERLYTGTASAPVPVDEKGRIRVDDWEMREDIQAEVKRLWPLVDTANLAEWSDGTGYRDDFLRLFGFGIAGVDYAADVPEERI
jgi:enoyl-[acyl-carrier protein] reductase/trans-2-enoyl-CoA reductase (NAD+)